MNKLFLSLVLSLSLSSSAFSATTATTTVSAVLQKTASVTTNGGTTSVTIDPNNGNMSGSLNPVFRVGTNSKLGATVQFDIKATTGTTTSVAIISGGSNVNSGKVALTLSDSTLSPALATITNALSASPVASSNTNTIAYPISFTASKGTNPSFTNATDINPSTTALTGNTDYTVNIGTSAIIGTYDNSDVAGSYEATITVTVSAL